MIENVSPLLRRQERSLLDCVNPFANVLRRRIWCLHERERLVTGRVVRTVFSHVERPPGAFAGGLGDPQAIRAVVPAPNQRGGNRDACEIVRRDPRDPNSRNRRPAIFALVGIDVPSRVKKTGRLCTSIGKANLTEHPEDHAILLCPTNGCFYLRLSGRAGSGAELPLVRGAGDVRQRIDARARFDAR